MKIFKWASWFMIFTGLIHLVGHFAPANLDSEEKKNLFDLMYGVDINLDPFFSRTIGNLFDAFSLSLTIMLITLAVVNLTVIRNNAEASLIKSLAYINAAGMFIMLVLAWLYLFSIPITLFTILFLMMLMAGIRTK